MRDNLKKFVVPSILLGIVITGLLTAQMSWRPQGDCATSPYREVTNTIQRIDCSTMEYGYPNKFLYTHPKVDVNALTDSKESPVQLGITSTIELSWTGMFMNILLWSSVSMVIFLLLSSVLAPTTHKKKK